MRRAVLGLSVALAATPALGGCGGDSSSQSAVRSALRDYVSSVYGRDGARLCARVAPPMAAGLMSELPATLAAGKPCGVRLSAAFAESPTPVPPAPRFSVSQVSVSGAKATATIRLTTRSVPFKLVRASSGRWLVSCCAGAQRDRLPTTEERVPSASMEPTLKVGSFFTLDQLAYRTAVPQIGDIVVFHPPAGDTSTCTVAAEGHPGGRPCSRPGAGTSAQRFVKRVVAGPGDTIAVRDGHVIRNGNLAAEPFIRACAKADTAVCDFPTAIVVPPDTYYLLGDNRGASEDSRFFGPIRRAAIIGKAKVG